MLARRSPNLVKIIKELSALQEEDSIKAATKQYSLEMLDKMDKKLLFLIKAERKKLRPAEDKILAQCDETALRNNLRSTLLVIANDQYPECRYLDRLLKKFKTVNKSPDDAEAYARKAKELKEFACEYKKMAGDLIRLEKFQSELRSIFVDRQRNSYRTTTMRSIDQALHDAIKSGKLNEVRALVKQGANIHATDNMDRTSLHLAAIHGHANIAKFLVHRHANVNAITNEGNTPLHLAEDCETAGYLLRKHADINALNYDIDTPLLKAINRNRPDLAAFLIEQGADVNLKNGWRFSPLHAAAYNGNTELMTLLVNKGAKVNARSKDNDTPLHGAALRAIINRNGNIDIVRHLVSLGGDVCARNDLGDLPLYWIASAKEFDREGLDLLCTKDNVNARNTSGETILHDITCKGRMDAVRYFVETAGANVNVKDYQGNTPLHALASDYRATLEMAKYLVEHGADPAAVNDEKQMPADVAREQNVEIRNFLREAAARQIADRQKNAVSITAPVGTLFQQPAGAANAPAVHASKEYRR